MEDLAGRQFGPYRIIAPLGEGGMAAVYKAYQANVDRYVAVKVLPRYFASDPDYVSRFQQEARVLARLQHPHILPVHDYGQADGYTYIVMPFVQSGTLESLLEGRPLPLARMQMIIQQVGDALDYAHSKGVIHRDIKPSNILLDSRGNCLLTDFGIAKIVEGTSQITRTGGIIGTPAYMSPEQIEGKPLDGRSDIYSLGVVLYQMATGRPPFQAETPPAIMVKHLHDPLPPPRTFNPELPFAMESVILKALAKAPDDRFPTGQAMVQAMRKIDPTAPAAATVVVGMAGDPTVRLPQSTTAEQTVRAGTAQALAPPIVTTPYAGAAAQPTKQAAIPSAVPQNRQEEKRRSPWLLPAVGCLAVLLLLLIAAGASALILQQSDGSRIASLLGIAIPTQTATSTSTPADDQNVNVSTGGATASPTDSGSVASSQTPTASATLAAVDTPTATTTSTATAIPPSDTPVPPSHTPEPPTFTPVPPSSTFTPVPPTPTPTVPPTETPTLEPTFTPTPEEVSCAAVLPAPQISFSRQETIDGSTSLRYWLTIDNAAAFPDDLFAAAPELPPCGANTNASRSWISIFDANGDAYLYGYCAMSSMPAEVWFAAEPGTVANVYLALEDRECGINRASNTVAIP